MFFPAETPAIADLPTELGGIVTEALGRAGRSVRPVLITTLGGPGSGKSTYLRALRQAMNNPDWLDVAFDRLMESIPAYRADPDREHAFKTYELLARQTGYVLLRAAMEKGCSIVFEHSNARADHVDLLRFAKQIHGYHTVIVHLTASPQTAHRRLVERQKREGRYTPAHYVEERAAIIATLLPGYRDIADYFVSITNEADGEHIEKAARELALKLVPL